MERRDEDALRHLLETATAPAAARVVTQDDIGELRHRLDRARTEAAGLRQSSGGRLAARLRDNDSYLTDVKATLEAELAEVGKALAAAT
jgi:DNA-binding FadR family transcriptional regulator